MNFLPMWTPESKVINKNKIELSYEDEDERFFPHNKVEEIQSYQVSVPEVKEKRERENFFLEYDVCDVFKEN